MLSEPGFKQAPDHYNRPEGEVIDTMRRVFGDEAVRIWAMISAFKYRMRAGDKGDAATDIDKARWCEQFARFLNGEDEDPRSYRAGVVDTVRKPVVEVRQSRGLPVELTDDLADRLQDPHGSEELLDDTPIDPIQTEIEDADRQREIKQWAENWRTHLAKKRREAEKVLDSGNQPSQPEPDDRGVVEPKALREDSEVKRLLNQLMQQVDDLKAAQQEVAQVEEEPQAEHGYRVETAVSVNKIRRGSICFQDNRKPSMYMTNLVTDHVRPGQTIPAKYYTQPDFTYLGVALEDFGEREKPGLCEMVPLHQLLPEDANIPGRR